jgi:carboxypeptidase C (cathepsin A)
LKKALLLAASLWAVAGAVMAAETSPKSIHPDVAKPDAEAANAPPKERVGLFKPESVTTDGSVTVEGQRIDYRAVAGTLVVHGANWNDSAWREPVKDKDDKDGDKNAAEASMFYVAYFKKGAPSANRPITFIYNGGPGSSTVWLHMGAFGPRRVVTKDDTHTPAAPYEVVDNAYSPLDATDLVFIDAPGTGFGRLAGKDKEKAFWGTDQDRDAFDQFIRLFLSKYGRWNSPKYLFGESYGTPRSALVVNSLETTHDVDFNGVMLLSQILNFDLSIDGPDGNPGIDQPYIVGLPTYAATAWYHNKLPGQRPADLPTFLKEVEQFANGEYASALSAGSELDPARRQAVAEKYAQFTGLPVAYVLKANLRVTGGEFEKNLLDDQGLTTGRFDTRFTGPDMDPLSQSADYDPQSAAISSAYVTAFNDYVRGQLHYGDGQTYKQTIDVFKDWDFKHQPPGAPFALPGTVNVMPDLASAMKYNPNLKVMLNGGYYDLATPFYEGWYEMHHLPIPAKLQGNIEYHYYESGHMVYAHQDSLKQLHDNVASFIHRTESATR